MTRSGVADQPERSIQIPRPFAFLEEKPAVCLQAGQNTALIFRQVAPALGGLHLPSKLRTLWRLNARDDIDPLFHRFKKPRKAKSPRPF